MALFQLLLEPHSFSRQVRMSCSRAPQVRQPTTGDQTQYHVTRDSNTQATTQTSSCAELTNHVVDPPPPPPPPGPQTTPPPARESNSRRPSPRPSPTLSRRESESEWNGPRQTQPSPPAQPDPLRPTAAAAAAAAAASATPAPVPAPVRAATPAQAIAGCTVPSLSLLDVVFY